ncbi:MAG: nicotinate-nucleotide adenylyltransferase [Gemmatimonadetes bacterium]|nr:nicotinate-nucleotide adenylyltransferase [Gemmatimonadota bacterium]NIQ52051.1 nicotinate-nucleotide adenylyltransferase [Gemmatimonadota bacterium]NIU72148.1 nicotinate-nucleotide adenylyltransferase [Gammaproteobacteria bacterium]NIX42700.1 nicotinate-nucleotide adenylyltransferase [Gemmatimonadota bacterium]NIY06865.1 nicotinate-nucleotide adenylyltransferase [Gemmatimonadota bacterium]
MAGPARIGVFGGTFDPPHIGHLVAAQELHDQLALDRLLLVPAAVPPHKTDRTVTPGAVRLAMLRAAVEGDARFEISELELERDGPSYTVDTLRELRRRHPEAALLLAVGADQLAELESWRDPDGIAALAELVAFRRGGQPVPETARSVRVVEVPAVEVSSTAVRERVAAGRPVRYLVPEAVRKVIDREGLYR